MRLTEKRFSHSHIGGSGSEGHTSFTSLNEEALKGVSSATGGVVPSSSTQQSVQPAAVQSTSLSPQQKKHIDFMIRRGIEAGKIIDKKTIQSLSEEIMSLSQQLSLQSEERKRLSSSSLSSAVSPTDVTGRIVDERDSKRPNGTRSRGNALKRDGNKVREDDTHDIVGIRRHATTVHRVDGTDEYATYQIHLLYSFLCGGVMVFILSAVLSWLYECFSH